MLDFLKRKKQPHIDNTPKSSKSVFAQFKQHVRALFTSNTLDDASLESLETLLLTADVGIDATEEILLALKSALKNNPPSDPSAITHALKDILTARLLPVTKPLVISSPPKPFVILTVGVNGAGKTTTIGKLAKYYQDQGKQVMLAAGDTFRAAAIEQLAAWGDKHQIPVIAQQAGADSASVIFDALQTATAKSIDLLIADTAGRLHTQQHLMEELKKIIRVMRKKDDTAPHEILLILDASLGQNSLLQAKNFHEALGVTGLILTKLDGTAKGGVIFNIAHTLTLPIRFIGAGEGELDLQVFDAKQFVEELFNDGSSQ